MSEPAIFISERAAAAHAAYATANDPMILKTFVNVVMRSEAILGWSVNLIFKNGYRARMTEKHVETLNTLCAAAALGA